MAPSAAAGTKRKKPPTFQHLPEQRAKKLKRDWVDKQKIKSKWKAQKRREGIVTQRDAVASSSKPQGEDPDEDAATDAGSLNEEGEEDSDEGSAEEEEEEESDASSEEEEFHRSDSAFSLSPPRTHPRDQPPPKELPDDASLRELQRLAYSRSSLHHFKSDPLHRSRGRGGLRGGSESNRGGERGRRHGRGTDRRRGRGTDRGRGRGAERSRGGGERGRGRGSARGGQPDMRLRMNALLQKVRKEFEG